VKISLGLPDLFPYVVAVSLLGVKNVALFQTEQRIKLLSRWENNRDSPVFDALFVDRAFLFPCSVGLNAALGETLGTLDLSRTLDYRSHTPVIISQLQARIDMERRERLLMTEGRVFWTEFGECGTMPLGLKQALSQVSFEVARILFLLLGDSLCWSALKSPSRKCPHCSSKFTTEHFFSCQRFFAQDAGWRTFVALSRTDAWEDFLDFVMTVLKKWVLETPLFRPTFRLHVQEYENLCIDPVHSAFRWNFL
jgi:hypothetical protein